MFTNMKDIIPFLKLLQVVKEAGLGDPELGTTYDWAISAYQLANDSGDTPAWNFYYVLGRML